MQANNYNSLQLHDHHATSSPASMMNNPTSSSYYTSASRSFVFDELEPIINPSANAHSNFGLGSGGGGGGDAHSHSGPLSHMNYLDLVSGTHTCGTVGPIETNDGSDAVADSGNPSSHRISTLNTMQGAFDFHHPLFASTPGGGTYGNVKEEDLYYTYNHHQLVSSVGGHHLPPLIETNNTSTTSSSCSVGGSSYCPSSKANNGIITSNNSMVNTNSTNTNTNISHIGSILNDHVLCNPTTSNSSSHQLHENNNNIDLIWSFAKHT